jgi:A/G-specific adenine glycosylase
MTIADESAKAASLRRSLLAYYRRRGRALPWRKTRDPYAIWVSEIMLQQTQVQTVIPRFTEFLRRFPTMAALAAAQESTVCEAWAGLGYYRRARNMHRAARQILAQHGGKMPASADALRQLPGIGDYTAAAIASIAFGESVAAIDGNLVRVIARVFALPGRASDTRLIRRVRERAQRLVDGPSPGDVNQALMDIGATVCRTTRPLCDECPVGQACAARGSQDPSAFPGKKPKAPRRILRIAFAWIERDGVLLLEQRPLDGLWPGLWELPSAAGPHARENLVKRLGRPLGRRIVRITHALTHRRVEASVYQASQARPLGRPWASPLSAPLSALARKAIIAVEHAKAAARARG